MSTLTTMAAAGPDIRHEGKIYRLSLFTLGVRARYTQWLRGRWLSVRRLAAEGLSPAERADFLSLAADQVSRGVADFGWCHPQDRGKATDDPTRTPTFAEQTLESQEGQAELLRQLLAPHHPDADDELAAAMWQRSTDEVLAAFAIIFPPKNAPTPAAKGLTGDADWIELYTWFAEKRNWTHEQVNALTVEAANAYRGVRPGCGPGGGGYKDDFWALWRRRGLTEQQIAERWEKRKRPKIRVRKNR